MKTLIVSILILFSCCGTTSAQTISSKNTAYTGDDGTITLSNGGYTSGKSYKIDYNYADMNGVTTPVTTTVTANENSEIVILNLSIGKYSSFKVDGNAITGIINIDYANIAINKWQAFASYFSSFSGLPDDNSSSYNQIYARASIPLNKSDGIRCDQNFCRRWIWFRNIFLQLNFSTNVNDLHAFYDSSNLTQNTNNPTRYVNKLDLIKYEKENISANLNVLTLVLPKTKGRGDNGHLYLDVLGGIIATNIYDSTFGDKFLTKAVKYGFNLKYRAENINVGDHSLGIELSTELLWLKSIDDNVNANMNPQNTNRIHSLITGSNKPFLISNAPYWHPELLLYYNTGESDDSISSSNIFFRCSFYSNFAGLSLQHFANNYLQFQIGYAMSIKKLLSMAN